MAARPGRRTGWRILRARRSGFALAFAWLVSQAFGSEPRFELLAAPQLFAPGIASTPHSEVRLTLSPDGNTALWFARDRPGGAGGYDIWISQRRDAGWSEPTPVAFNSPQRDFDPAFSADGRFVYFSSDRSGGLGGDDIYRVTVSPGGFGSPELLDASVNSPGNEWAPMLSRSDHLLFSSDGRGGAGRMDLFIAHARRDGGFDAAMPVAGSLNTQADEFDATFLDDGAIVFSRAANLREDAVYLFIATRNAAGYGIGTRLPDPINAGDKSSYAPMVDWSNPGRFTYTRAGELYIASYRMKSP